jgi:hypothetical protein
MIADFTIEDMQHSAEGAAEQAVAELLEKGIPIFYMENNLDVIEHANGQRFQIQYKGLSRGAYQTVRELPRRP